MRTYHHADFPAERLRAERGAESISVCVPAREEAATIGAGSSRRCVALREAGVIDQVVVVDADSADGTGAIAARTWAPRCTRQAALLPELRAGAAARATRCGGR